MERSGAFRPVRVLDLALPAGSHPSGPWQSCPSPWLSSWLPRRTEDDRTAGRLRCTASKAGAAMSAGVPPGEPLAAMTPAGRVARWALSVQFAIKAASEDEARVVLREVLAGLVRELSLCGAGSSAASGLPQPTWT